MYTRGTAFRNLPTRLPEQIDRLEHVGCCTVQFRMVMKDSTLPLT